LNKQEEESAATAAVLGQTVVQNLFGAGQNPVDQTIRINNVPFRVVGVLTPKGQSTQGQDQDDAVFIPFSTAERKVLGTRMLGSVGAIMVSAVSPEAIPEAQRQITNLLRERHRIRRGQNDDFTIRNLADIAATAESTSQVMNILLASVASVSLLVGGIGIMNIMLVSVTERTREIGIRLAIGALERQVLTQFLVEAVVLSLFGGFVGIILGLSLAWLAIAAMGVPFIVDPAIILIAFGFSALVGVIFGYFPARRAAHLDPIEALRRE
jgi:putative ABC transport system permease protein